MALFGKSDKKAKQSPPAQPSKPSLQQQHAQHHMQLRNHLRHRFRLSNVLGDPFALSTISIGTIGWVIALTGSITISATTQKFPVFTWWAVASEFLVILAIFWVCATNNVHPYRLALLAALATTTVYTTNSTNNFVYTSSPTSAAASAGYILLSIINILWMLYFGTTEEAPLHRLIDSYAVNKPAYGADYYYSALGGPPGAPGRNHPFSYATAGGNQGMQPGGATQAPGGPYRDSSAYGTIPGTALMNQQKPSLSQYYGNEHDNPYSQQQSFMAAPLGAFENSSQIHHSRSFNGRNSSQVQSQAYGPQSMIGTGTGPSQGLAGIAAASAAQGGYAGYGGYGYRASAASTADRTSAGDIIATPTEYPYRVRANYSYTASDDNELSFKKDEILEVSDISGKWWQARKGNGEIGICPSNYVTLLGDDGEPYQAGGDQYGNAGDTLSSTITTTTTTTTGYQNL